MSRSSDELRELRQEFGHKRDLMVEHQEKFFDLSKTTTDYAERIVAEGISRLSLVLVDVYKHLDYLWLSSLAGKAQTEILLNTILDLPDVKQNQELMDRIRKAFADYAAEYQHE